MARAEFAQARENSAILDSRAFDTAQVDLVKAIQGIKTSLDMEISNQLGCSRTFYPNDADFFACARRMQAELTACQQYVAYELYPPATPLPGITTFDQCIGRKDGSGNPLILGCDGKQALIELRGLFNDYRSIKTKAENIDKRIQYSAERNATVTPGSASRAPRRPRPLFPARCYLRSVRWAARGTP